MGYFDERDIPYYHALAKSFTICDRYFCSAMGATDPPHTATKRRSPIAGEGA